MGKENEQINVITVKVTGDVMIATTTATSDIVSSPAPSIWGEFFDPHYLGVISFRFQNFGGKIIVGARMSLY